MSYRRLSKSACDTFRPISRRLEAMLDPRRCASSVGQAGFLAWFQDNHSPFSNLKLLNTLIAFVCYFLLLIGNDCHNA